jgi:hypothetical protein
MGFNSGFKWLIFCLHFDVIQAYAKPKEQNALIEVKRLVGSKHVLNMKTASRVPFVTVIKQKLMSYSMLLLSGL